jgi:hypothetical protein
MAKLNKQSVKVLADLLIDKDEQEGCLSYLEEMQD